MALTKTQISELYVSIFNRASEKSGSQNWLNSGYNTDATAMANAMLATDAAKTYFGTSLVSDAAFVEHIYANTLNKGGATVDAAGKAGWVEFLKTGASRGEMVAKMIEAIKEYQVGGAKYATADQATKDAAQQFENRVKVSDYTADNLETIAVSEINSTLSFSSALTVTADPATVETAKKSVQALTIDGTTFSLTTGTDDLKGTDNADLFKAVNSSMISEGTLQGGDKIDGGAGNDTLKVDMKQNFDGFTTGSMKNVEKVELTNSSNANLTFKASNVEGVTKYVVTDAVDRNTTISDVASLADIEISGTADTANTTLSVAYAATSTVATGTQTDVQNLKVTNQGSINTKTDGTTNAKFMTVDIDKVETLAITTAGTANSLDLSQSADVKTVTVAGEGQTEIRAVGTATTSFDASAATGKVIANLANAASNSLTTVKGGSSDDSLTVVADDLTTSATVDGGAGSDKLIIGAGAGKTLQLGMTGVETLEVGAITSALTFSGTNVSDLTTLKVEGLGSTVSLVNSKATDLTVNSVGVNGQAISTDNAAKVTYNMDATAANLAANATAAHTGAATFSNATNLTVNVNKAVVSSTGAINAANATDVKVNIDTKVVNGTEQTTFANTLNAAKAKTITVDSKGQLAAGATIAAAEATTATITAGSTAAVNDILVLNAAKLNTLNITAKQDFALTGSTLTKVQNMTVDTTKAFTMGAVALADAANVTVSGTASTSSATFGTLGTAGQTHATNLTATGLKTGLTTGAINAGTSSSTINVSGVTGNVTLAAITADSGITLTATNLGGNLANATAALTTTGKIDVDVSNAKGSVTLGTLATNGSGDVTLNASSTVGAVAVGAITGNNVTINGQGALGGVVVGTGTAAGTDVTAKTSVTYTGTNIANNGIDIATHADSTAFTATLNGGASNETFTIAGNAKQTGITVTGNLGAGTNSVTTTLVNSTSNAQTVNLSGLTGSDKASTTTTTNIAAALVATTEDAITFTGSAMNDTIVVDSTTAAVVSTKAVSISDSTTTDSDTLSLKAAVNAISFTNLSLSNIEKLIVDDTAAVTINASAISGKAIAVNGAAASDILNLKGTAGADVIDLSKITDGGNDAVFAITGLAGADTFVGSVFNDSYVIADASVDSTSAAMDSITSFTIGANDTINLATAANGTTASGAITFAVAANVTATAGTTNGIATGMFTFDEAAATSLSDAITKVGTDVTTAGNAVIFEYAGDTYFFADTDGAATTASDLIIKLVGVDSASMSAAAEVFTIA